MTDWITIPKGSSAGRATIRARGAFSWAEALDVLTNFGPTGRHGRAGASPLRMTFALDSTFEPVGVAITPTTDGLDVEVAGTHDIEAAARQVARIFSLDHDGEGYEALGRRDTAFGRLQAARPGLRPVCFTSPYECAAWAIMSQRISMRQAAAVEDRLIAEHGHPIVVAGESVRAFPSPRRLVNVGAVPGLAAEKVDRLHAVARAALDGLLDVDRLRALGDDAGPASLLAIRGIGPFWSSGIYLRGCGIVDVFPDEPLSIAALGALHGLGDRPTAAQVETLTDAYRPFRMWACFLLRVAAGRGIITGLTGREMAIREASRRPRRSARSEG